VEVLFNIILPIYELRYLLLKFCNFFLLLDPSTVVRLLKMSLSFCFKHYLLDLSRSGLWFSILPTMTNARGSSLPPCAANPAALLCLTRPSSPFLAVIRPKILNLPSRHTSPRRRSPTASTCGWATNKRRPLPNYRTLLASHYNQVRRPENPR